MALGWDARKQAVALEQRLHTFCYNMARGKPKFHIAAVSLQAQET